MLISWVSVFIGLFILFAIYRNKDISENKDKSDLYSYFVLSLVLNLVLCGLGFLYPARAAIHQTNGIVFFWFLTTAVTVSSEGPIRVISRIMWVAFTAFVIMGSFM